MECCFEGLHREINLDHELFGILGQGIFRAIDHVVVSINHGK